MFFGFSISIGSGFLSVKFPSLFTSEDFIFTLFIMIEFMMLPLLYLYNKFITDKSLKSIFCFLYVVYISIF